MKLVFLHIRKTAGTSFKILAFDNYGEDQVFWSDTSDVINSVIDNENIKVFGGHFSYSEIHNGINDDTVYCAIVRNPVDRVLSLYSHHNSKEIWGRKFDGFSNTSIYDSIINCREFGGLCNNDQCFTISGKRTFDETIDLVGSGNFIVGTIDHIELLISKIGTMFGWDIGKITKSNTASGNFKNKIVLDKKKIDLIEPIVAEDQKLYEFVSKHKIYISPKLERMHLLGAHDKFMRKNVSLTSVDRALVGIDIPIGKLVCAPNERFSLPVSIKNCSSRTLHKDGKGCVKVSYHIFDSGRVLQLWDGHRTYLPCDIEPQKDSLAYAVVKAPSVCGTYYVKIGLIHDELAWFEYSNPTHEKEFLLLVQEKTLNLNQYLPENLPVSRMLPDFSKLLEAGKLTDGGLEFQLVSGWYETEFVPNPARWVQAKAIFSIHSPVATQIVLAITLASFYRSRRCLICVNGKEVLLSTVGTDPSCLYIPMCLQDGNNEVVIESQDGSQSPASIESMHSPDPRQLAFHVRNVDVIWNWHKSETFQNHQ